MADPYAQFTGPAAAGAAPGAAPNDPYAQFTGAPGASGGAGFTIDFTKPQEQVGAQIKALPQQYQQQAFKDYGDFVGAQNQGEGGFWQGVANFGRGVGQGLSMDWGDEALAGIKTLGGAVGDYDTQLAIQQGYNRKADEASPIAATTGYVLGSLAPSAIPVGGWLYAGGRTAATAAQGARALAPTALRAAGIGATEGVIQGGVQGAGAAEPGDRLSGAAWGAGLGGVGGGVLGGGIGAIGHRIGANRVAADLAARTDPNIEGALAHLGADAPFAFKAQDPLVAEAAQRFAQRPIPAAAQVREALERGYTSIGEGAENTLLSRAGGGDLEGVVSTGGEAIRSVVGARATQIDNMMGAEKQALLNTVGADTDVPLTNFRQALGQMVVNRMQKGENPWEGFEKFGNVARSGANLDIATQIFTDLGELKGLPTLVTADAARKPHFSALFGALADDIRNAAARRGHPQIWDNYRNAITQLADERRLLRSSFSDKPGNEEKLVRTAQAWMSRGGAGPSSSRVNALDDALRAARSSQPTANIGPEIARGLYAQTLSRAGNDYAGGSPQKVATALERQTRNAADLIRNMDADTARTMAMHQVLALRGRQMMRARSHSGTPAGMEAAGLGRTVMDSMGAMSGAAGSALTGAVDPVTGFILGGIGKGVRNRYRGAQDQRMAQYYLTGRKPGLLPTMIRGGP